MHIGLECTHLTRSLAGIGYYLYHILNEIARLEGDEEYTLFYNRPLVDAPLPARMKHALNPPRSTHLWAQTRLASLCRQHKIDLLHSPGQALPLWYNGKTILTVHDLSPLLFPKQKDWGSRFVWTQLVPRMAKKADHIITVSNHTKQDVLHLLHIPEERITTIHEAAADEYYPIADQDEIEAFRQKHNLTRPFFLSVSTLEPRKNYPFLFRVFAEWLKQSGEDAQIVIIGKKGWYYDEIFSTVEKLNLQNHIRFEGYVADLNVMRYYYNAADALLMSPIYEGFWLPGLEALACGTPVIAPNHSSITEVIGGAGMLISSWDVDEWVSVIHQFWNTKDSADWRQRGIHQAAKFSWKRAAQQHLDVYRKAGGA